MSEHKLTPKVARILADNGVDVPLDKVEDRHDDAEVAIARTLHRAVVTPSRKSDGDLLRPIYDLRETLDAYADDTEDELVFDTTWTVRGIPSITMAVLEANYAREIPECERRRYSLARVITALVDWRLQALQNVPDVIAYRKARNGAVRAAYKDPAAAVSLRAWMKASSYVAPAAHGGTEDFTVRTTKPVSNLAGALAVELGVKKGALIAACLAGELAQLHVTEPEHAALTEQWNALIEEVSQRLEELKSRVMRAWAKGRE